jgi:hypothetical protein
MAARNEISIHQEYALCAPFMSGSRAHSGLDGTERSRRSGRQVTILIGHKVFAMLSLFTLYHSTSNAAFITVFLV